MPPKEDKKDPNELVLNENVSMHGKTYLINTVPPSDLAADLKKKGFLSKRSEVEKSLTPSHSSLEAKVKSLEKDNAQLKASNTQSRATIKDLNEQIARLEKQIAELKKK